MKTIMRIILLLGLCSFCRAETVDVHYGFINLPDGYIFFDRPGIDTVCPHFIRTNDNFTVRSDMGRMAGYFVCPFHNSPFWNEHPPSWWNKNGYSYFRRLRINGKPTCIAMEIKGEKKVIKATLASAFVKDIMDKSEKENWPEEKYRKARKRLEMDNPINFSATINTDEDLIDFLLIVFSYNGKPNSNQQVEPIVKTPGDEVEVQGTQAHP